jgi:hypothetical protein
MLVPARRGRLLVFGTPAAGWGRADIIRIYAESAAPVAQLLEVPVECRIPPVLVRN